VLAAALALVLSGCGSAAMSTTTTTTTTTTTQSAVHASTAFAAARAEWLFAPNVSGSAEQGIPFQNAINDLGLAARTGESTAGVTTAIGELKALLTLPDAMPTAAQRAEYQRDYTALDTFFKTPDLWGAGTP
jgi:hypothetical protein